MECLGRSDTFIFLSLVETNERGTIQTKTTQSRWNVIKDHRPYNRFSFFFACFYLHLNNNKKNVAVMLDIYLNVVFLLWKGKKNKNIWKKTMGLFRSTIYRFQYKNMVLFSNIYMRWDSLGTK